MPQYRIYRLDGGGRVSTAGWLDAPSDEAAIEAVRAKGPVHELWQRRRLVARFPGDGEGDTAPLHPSAVHGSTRIRSIAAFGR